MRRIPAVVSVLCTVLCSTLLVPAADDRLDARKIVNQAKAEASAVPAQAEALVRLAWFDPGQPQEVRAMAREELEIFAAKGLKALHQAVRLVDEAQTLDVAATLLQARVRILAVVPPAFAAALEDLLWYGSVDAKRLAIPQLATARFTPAVPACVDAAYEHPELAVHVIRWLPAFRWDIARFALGDFLDDGTPAERAAAAQSLAEIGGLAMETLRQATLSEDPYTRRVALEAFLPSSRVMDLTALYEFLARFTEEDPELLERVRARAVQLEALLEKQQAEEAAGD